MAIFEVIKKEKEDNNLVWRYPKTNFNTLSQLIVHESQEALFFSNGKALDLFGPGKYTLNTNNIPLLRSVLEIPTGFKSPFQCEVYFIDKTEKNTKWGTNSKIEYLDPKYNFPIQIGACGEIRFIIEDSRKLLIKLVGIKKTIDNTNIDEFFASYILTNVKSYISNMIIEKKICIFEIDQNLELFNEEIKKILEQDFSDYGIKLNKFIITTIVKPEEDKQYLQFKELFYKQTISIAEAELRQKVNIMDEETKAKQKIIASIAEATKRAQEGYTYQDQRSYDVSEKIAENESIGQLTNVGVGLGVMSGVGTTLGNQIGNQVSGVMANVDTNNTCAKCGNQNAISSKFCSKCGSVLNRRCASCNFEMSADDVFCSKCGRKIGE